MRVLILATTTGYQTRAFGEAAERLRVDLVFATDRCHVLDDPWRDQAVPIRFHDEEASLQAILQLARPIDGVVSVGDQPTRIAARLLRALGLPGHPAEAVTIARNKLLTRQALQRAGLQVPWFRAVAIDADPEALAAQVRYPCVIKPLGLSASRGVMRADEPTGFAASVRRLLRLLESPAVRAERNPLSEGAVVEGFIPGREFAVEAIVDRGELHVLTIFDKPDPLDGPFFEETIYLTPSAAPPAVQKDISVALSRAVDVIGLSHGPIHAECRVNQQGVFLLEIAARPIGGLCARALRFERVGGPDSQPVPFEEVLLRHALGESPQDWRREAAASGVMMIPIPARGTLRDVGGVEEARGVAGVTDVRITAKLGHLLVPLPEGATYLGFIFARGTEASEVDQAIRQAHRKLRFTIEPEISVVQSPHV
jgi:biotin carboxylase